MLARTKIIHTSDRSGLRIHSIRFVYGDTASVSPLNRTMRKYRCSLCIPKMGATGLVIVRFFKGDRLAEGMRKNQGKRPRRKHVIKKYPMGKTLGRPCRFLL